MGQTLPGPLRTPLSGPGAKYERGGLIGFFLPWTWLLWIPIPQIPARDSLLLRPKLISRRIFAPPRRGQSVGGCRLSRRRGQGAFAATPATRVVVPPPVTPEGIKETTRMRLVRLARAIPRVRTTATTATTDLVAELKVGNALRTYCRRFTEGDVEAYAELSGHCSPVHVDDDAIDRWPGAFRKGSVVHGMLVASLFPAVIASHFPGAVYASQSLRFAAPVFAGDVVLPQVQVLHIKATGERHIVKFATNASCMMKLLSPLTAWPWLSCPHLSAMRRQSSDKYVDLTMIDGFGMR